MGRFARLLNVGIGLSVALILAGLFAYYNSTLHELRLWFSEINQVEREISFRTEAGLYYSFFKQLVQWRGKGDGVDELLLRDKLTEWPSEINAVQRFNIYQEISLANVYRHLSESGLTDLLEPIIFYTHACFAFTGLLVLSTFLLSWNLSPSDGDWTSGLLAASWLFANFQDSTRAHFTVNLRENFALPLLFLQNSRVVRLLEGKGWRVVNMGSIAFLTFKFALLWQMSQFLLAMQSISLLLTLLLQPERRSTVAMALLAQSLGYAAAIPAQYYQPMMLSSLTLCVNFGILASMAAFRLDSKRSRVLFVGVAGVLAASTHLFLKHSFNPTAADSHIWSFLANKLFQLAPTLAEKLPFVGEVSFDTALYLCHGAFSALETGFWERTNRSGLLPLYSLAIATASYSVFKSSERPSITYLTVQSLLAGALAAMSMRMKYLWVPMMAVLASHSVSVLDRWIGKWARRALVVALAAGLLYGRYGEYVKEMDNEQTASFTGSMQLMAGVRACTLRPILNHPHFEDEWLRQRTHRLYQIYSRRPVEKVHAMLKAEKADYVILEDSICLTQSNGCSTNDIMDYTDGLKTDSGLVKFPIRKPLEKSSVERFCNAVRRFGRDSKEIFRLVIENRTFRVYKVL